MFNFDKIKTTGYFASDSVEKVIEFSPPNLDAGDVIKVLSLSADGIATDTDAVSDGAQITGRVNFKLLYLNRDGEVRALDYNADFSVTVTADFPSAATIDADVTVKEADVSSGANGLTLTAVIEVKATATGIDEYDALTFADDAYVEKIRVERRRAVCSYRGIIETDDEQNAGKVDKVLALSSTVSLTGLTAGEDLVLVNGNLTQTVVYIAENELKTLVFDIPVSEEIACEGAILGDTVLGKLYVKRAKIVLGGTDDDAVIRVESDLGLCLSVTRSALEDEVKDVFSLTNELNVEKTDGTRRVFTGSLFRSAKLNGAATLSDNRAAARDIVCVPSSRCIVARVDTEDGVKVEGLVSADVIYTDENGYNSVRAEIPFSVSLPVDCAENMSACGSIGEISARVRRDKEIEVFATVDFKLDCFAVENYSFVSSVELGEAKPTNRSPLSVYMPAEGETMWDAAKALTAMPELILEQNVGLSEPFKGNEKIVYFRKIS